MLGLQGQAGYDHEDHALTYSYSSMNQQTNAWTTTDYNVSYLKQDGYLESSTTGTSSDPSLLATTDTSYYDAFGRRAAIDAHSQGQTTDQVRAFAFDAMGEILEARAGTATVPPPAGGSGGGGGDGGGTPIRVEAIGTRAAIAPKAVTTQTTGAVFTPTGSYSTRHYAYVNGQQIGEVNEGGGIDVLSGVTGFSNTAQGESNYVVRKRPPPHLASPRLA